jgi:hypothetical protein
VGRRPRLELGPSRLGASVFHARGVFDANRMAVAHGVQARPVIEFVLDFVDLRGHRITARHGHRPPARLQGHTAGKPAADETGGESGHLTQELLNAFGTKQCVLQFLKIRISVIARIVNHWHTFG